jgi:hypothetical protein
MLENFKSDFISSSYSVEGFLLTPARSAWALLGGLISGLFIVPVLS